MFKFGSIESSWKVGAVYADSYNIQYYRLLNPVFVIHSSC
jgi:hypothetical protein